MSTFQRMLEVLGARETGSRDRFIADILARVGAARFGRRGRGLRRRELAARKRRRRSDQAMSTERLEQRQLLAVSTYATAGIGGGWVTVVAESGDEVFIQQVAGSPQSLNVADNSSFLRRTVVGGATTMPLPTGTDRLLPGTNINSLDRIVIISGTGRKDSTTLPYGYPMYSAGWTRFTLEDDGLNLSRELSGSFSIVQPDGNVSRWTFTNQSSAGITITGPGATTSIPSGYYYPIRVEGNPAAFDSNRKYGADSFSNSAVSIRWNVDYLPKDTVPTLDSVTWTSDESANRNSPFAATYTRVGPYSPQSPANMYIPFGNASGLGLGPVDPTSFEGFVSVGGRSYRVTTGGPSATTNDLYFNGQAKITVAYRQGGSGDYALDHNITGRLLVGTAADGFRRGLLLTASGEFGFGSSPLGYAFLQSARYALQTVSGDPVNATIFSGQNITAALDVNLTQPGSTFNLDSPVDGNPLRNSGITIRATNTVFNADASTRKDLVIGAPTVDSSRAIETAKPVAIVRDGRVVRIVIPNGLGGAGYTDADAPVVTIASPPQGGLAASRVAKLGRVTIDSATSRIVGIDVEDGGEGYADPPSVVVSAPRAASSVGRIGAVVAADGSISGVQFAYGSGLTARVIEIGANGSITAAIVADGGAGYAVGDLVSIDSGAGRAAQFRVLEVDGGQIVRFEIVTGGSGYAVDQRLFDPGAPSQGYGYKTAPRVWVASPGTPDGSVAEITAKIDGAGRVTGFVVNPQRAGKGYSQASPPSMTIEGGSATAQAEKVRFNARVAASNYLISLADDALSSIIGQDDTFRSALTVSNTGSLSASLDGSVAASTALIEVRQGDILLEGKVNAREQSYLMQSNPEDQWLLPFRITTTAEGSSVATGVIEGDTVAVTLANDLDTPQDGAVAFNQVDIRTDVTSLRIRASTRSGGSIRQPFPYSLRIQEVDDVIVESVAASSFPIQLVAGGGITLRAAIDTANGLDIQCGNTFEVTAPIKTTLGQISIKSSAISIRNSLQVTATPLEESREDIVLSATAGDIVMNGGTVSARNRVVINQRKRDPRFFTFTKASKIDIPDNGSAVTLGVTVPSGLAIDDINVSLDITHPDVGDLSATLVSPEGVRVALIPRFSLTGANLSGTTFDSEATATIFSSKAPYSGTFKPSGDLTSVYKRPTGGEWKLEVRDWSSGDVGTLNSFTVTFRDPVGNPGGTISGTSLVRADTLVVDAEGSVGKPSLLAGEDGFYLQTDVNTLIGYCIGSFAVSDVSDLDCNSLGAGGLVSLRANGVDPKVGSDGRTVKAALRGSLRDVFALEVSAPRGSIALDVNTPNDIAMGNEQGLSLAQSIRGNKLPSMVAAGSVRITSIGGSTGGVFSVMDAPIAGGGASQVRSATAVSGLQAIYDPGTPGLYASKITAKAVGGIGAGLFNNANLAVAVGDRILVNNPVNTADTPNAKVMNGIYAVTKVGDAATKWELTRVADADTAAELPVNTIVKVYDGSSAEKFYRLIPVASTKPFGSGEITVLPISALEMSIGSNDPSDDVRFIVSTTDGTNDSPGSFGKMIRIRQENVTPKGGGEGMTFQFSANIGSAIKLTQQLPIITKPFVIDGANRDTGSGKPIAIDGNRITVTRSGAGVGLRTPVDGIVFASTSTGAKLSNMIIGGFNQNDSTAVVVDGGSSVTLDAIVLGEDGDGNRLANLNGIVVRDGANGVVSSGVAVINSRISSTGRVAVSLQGKAAGVTFVGNTIGKNGYDNVVGIEVKSSGAGIAIGSATPDPITKAMPAPNRISFNTTGITLAGTSGVQVVNSIVTENTTDGIYITAGKNQIGSATVPVPLAPSLPGGNQIHMNKGWGVRIAAATKTAADALAAQQVIGGNYFVEPGAGKNDTTKENRWGAVGVSESLSAAAQVYAGIGSISQPSLTPYPVGYADPTLVGIDPSGNQHFGVGDNIGPVLTVLSPVDATGASLATSAVPFPASLEITGAQAGVATAFLLSLQDLGSGILGSSVDKSAFTLKRDGATLAEGKDYKFGVTGTGPMTVRFEKLGGAAFELGTYEIIAKAKSGNETTPGKFSGGLLTDKVNNTLQSNGATANTATFTVRLVGAQAPTDVSAAAGDGEASLSWKQPVDTGKAEITGYLIQATTDSGKTWVDVVADTGSSVETATIGGLTNGLTYVFRVAALTAAGRGVLSANSNAVKPGLNAPGTPTVTPAGSTAILKWTAPTGATGITTYVIQESLDGGKNWKLSTTSALPNPGATDLESTVSGLANGAQYVFRVAGVTAVGTGNWSAATSPVLVLAGPPGVRATAGNRQNTVEWLAPTIAGPVVITDYLLQSSVDGGTTWTDVVDAVSTAVSSIVPATNGITYVYRVAAKTDVGTGDWSAPTVAVTPIGPATAPRTVVATAGDAKVTLTWTEPLSNGGSSITDYSIQSSTDNGVKWVTHTDGVKATPGAEITGLKNGTTYVFRVGAITANGGGDWSAATEAVTPRQPASAPLNLVAAGGDARATLTWTAPKTDGGSPVTDYAVQRSTDAGKTWTDVADGVSALTNASLAGLTNGTSHVFRVAARTAAGLSAWSNVSNAIVPLAFATSPRNVVATPGDGLASVTWLAPATLGGSAVTDYRVQRSTDGGKTWTDVADGVSTVTKAVVAGLSNGTSHVFRVAAVTSAGVGAWSTASVAVVPRGAATAPQNLQATRGDRQVVLKWNQPVSNGGTTLRDYVVQRSTDGGTTWATVVDGVSAATGATVTGLVNGTSYVFRVAAVTDFATGAYTAPSAEVMPVAAPGAITGLSVQGDTSQFMLSWTAPTNTGGRPVIDYTIEYRSTESSVWAEWSHPASAATSATITQLSATMGYLFRVRPVTDFASGPVVETTEALVLLPQPTNLVGRGGIGSVALAWLPPRVTGGMRIVDYRVQYSVDGVNWTTASDGVSSASRTTVRGLKAGTAYVFRVAAVTAKGVGGYSTASARLAVR